VNAYNTKTASAVTGASERQLRYWDRQGVVKPSVGQAGGRGSRRLYSFLDLVQARAAKRLRDGGLSLQKLREALCILKEHPDKVRHPLAQLSLVTDGGTVFRLTDDKAVMQDILKRGQMVSVLAIKPLHDFVLAHLDRTVKVTRARVEVSGKAYKVTIEPDVVDGGFVAECPALRGCVTDGETPEEALRNIRDAITDWLASGQERHRARAQ
jgi:predicted RNase H-like HicB family nuclease